FADVFEARTALEDLERDARPSEAPCAIDEPIDEIPGLPKRPWGKLIFAAASIAALAFLSANPEGQRQIRSYLAYAETPAPVLRIERGTTTPSAPLVLHTCADRDIPLQ